MWWGYWVRCWCLNHVASVQLCREAQTTVAILCQLMVKLQSCFAEGNTSALWQAHIRSPCRNLLGTMRHHTRGRGEAPSRGAIRTLCDYHLLRCQSLQHLSAPTNKTRANRLAAAAVTVARPIWQGSLPLCMSCCSWATCQTSTRQNMLLQPDKEMTGAQGPAKFGQSQVPAVGSWAGQAIPSP